MNECKTILANAGITIIGKSNHNIWLQWKNGYKTIIRSDYLEQPVMLKAFIAKHNTIIKFLEFGGGSITEEFKKTMEALKVVREFCANYYREYDTVEALNCHDDCPFMDDRGGDCQCMITGDTEYSPMKWRYNIGV